MRREIKQNFLFWKNAVIDMMLPRFCFSCGSEGDLLCDECFSLWQPMQVTESKLKSSWIDGYIASFYYADPLIRQLIHAWKYSFDQNGWDFLRRKLYPNTHSLIALQQVKSFDYIVPISLSRKRFCERGFDQSNMIAEFISDLVDIPVKIFLTRKYFWKNQAECQDKERIDIMQKSPFTFMANEVPYNVLLVDDVWTTGATAMAAARVLKSAGVKEVWVYTIAQGR